MCARKNDQDVKEIEPKFPLRVLVNFLEMSDGKHSAWRHHKLARFVQGLGQEVSAEGEDKTTWNIMSVHSQGTVSEVRRPHRG